MVIINFLVKNVQLPSGQFKFWPIHRSVTWQTMLVTYPDLQLTWSWGPTAWQSYRVKQIWRFYWSPRTSTIQILHIKSRSIIESTILVGRHVYNLFLNKIGWIKLQTLVHWLSCKEHLATCKKKLDEVNIWRFMYLHISSYIFFRAPFQESLNYFQLF